MTAAIQEVEITPMRSKIGLWLGPLAFVLVLLFVDLDPNNPLVTRMAAVILLMAIWWITEAIPLSATALLPIVLFPLLGIMRGRLVPAANQIDFETVSMRNGLIPSDLDIVFPNVAGQYMDWIILLFLGGFIIATAVEKVEPAQTYRLEYLARYWRPVPSARSRIHACYRLSFHVVVQHLNRIDDDAHGNVAYSFI